MINVGAHVNWLNSYKLVKVMKGLVFSEVVIVELHKSRFKEISKEKSCIYGFDNPYPLIS